MQAYILFQYGESWNESESTPIGHSDIGVTLNVYTHLGLIDAKEEMNRIAKLA